MHACTHTHTHTLQGTVMQQQCTSVDINLIKAILQANRTIMHQLDDVCLLESEILAPPFVSTFKRSSTWPASYELSNSCEALEYR